MAVSPSGRDTNGNVLHNITSAAQTAVNALPSTSTVALQAANSALFKAQIDEVTYYMNTGRLNPATILSTLS